MTTWRVTYRQFEAGQERTCYFGTESDRKPPTGRMIRDHLGVVRQVLRIELVLPEGAKVYFKAPEPPIPPRENLPLPRLRARGRPRRDPSE